MRTTILLSALLIFGGLATAAYAQDSDDIGRQRLGQTGMKFLELSVDARAAAMGDALTATSASSTSLFYNPAGMAEMTENLHVGLGQVDWLADLSHSFGTIAFKPAGGRYGIVGVSVQSVSYGDVLSTVRANNEKGYVDVGTISPSGFAVGLGYARLITDRFSVGGQAKYVTQSLGSSFVQYDGGNGTIEDHEESALAADFGVLYKTGFRSLQFGASVRNFAREVRYAQDTFELPLTFRIGFAMNMLDLAGMQAGGDHDASLAVDFMRSRDYPEQVRAGLEYTFMNIISLRGGYVFPTDQQGLNLGAGLNYGFSGVQAAIDYAYTDFGIFGNVNRFAVSLGI